MLAALGFPRLRAKLSTTQKHQRAETKSPPRSCSLQTRTRKGHLAGQRLDPRTPAPQPCQQRASGDPDAHSLEAVTAPQGGLRACAVGVLPSQKRAPSQGQGLAPTHLQRPRGARLLRTLPRVSGDHGSWIPHGCPGGC